MGLDVHATATLKSWLLSDDHFVHPYPSSQERHELAQKAGITPKQVRNWFVNARKRIWQPLLIQMGADINEYVSAGRQVVPLHKRQRLQMDKILAQARKDLLQQHERVSSLSISNHVNDGIESRLPLRRGVWTPAELNYAYRLMDAFNNRQLDLDTKIPCTLRCFLAEKLQCHPMRISKKFTKHDSIGKLLYKGLASSISSSDMLQTKEELALLEKEFLESISIKRHALSVDSKVVDNSEEISFNIEACWPHDQLSENVWNHMGDEPIQWDMIKEESASTGPDDHCAHISDLEMISEVLNEVPPEDMNALLTDLHSFEENLEHLIGSPVEKEPHTERLGSTNNAWFNSFTPSESPMMPLHWF